MNETPVTFIPCPDPEEIYKAGKSTTGKTYMIDFIGVTEIDPDWINVKGFSPRTKIATPDGMFEIIGGEARSYEYKPFVIKVAE